MLVNVTTPLASATLTPRRQFWSSTPCEYIEYPPSRLQCQTYTATPTHGTPPFASSVMVSSRFIGTPSAVPLDSPKLDRISLRTMPLCSRTSGPFEPSPG